MNKQLAVAALSFVLFTVGVSAQAQQPAKIPRIGYLVPDRKPQSQSLHRRNGAGLSGFCGHEDWREV